MAQKEELSQNSSMEESAGFMGNTFMKIVEQKSMTLKPQHTHLPPPHTHMRAHHPHTHMHMQLIMTIACTCRILSPGWITDAAGPPGCTLVTKMPCEHMPQVRLRHQGLPSVGRAWCVFVCMSKYIRVCVLI